MISDCALGFSTDCISSGPTRQTIQTGRDGLRRPRPRRGRGPGRGAHRGQWRGPLPCRCESSFSEASTPSFFAFPFSNVSIFLLMGFATRAVTCRSGALGVTLLPVVSKAQNLKNRWAWGGQDLLNSPHGVSPPGPAGGLHPRIPGFGSLCSPLPPPQLSGLDPQLDVWLVSSLHLGTVLKMMAMKSLPGYRRNPQGPQHLPRPLPGHQLPGEIPASTGTTARIAAAREDQGSFHLYRSSTALLLYSEIMTLRIAGFK